MPNNNIIIFLGDSLTEWGNWNAYFPNKNILNYGIAGITTAGILARLNTLKEHQTHLLFFMAGINDLGNQESPETITQNYTAILNYFSNNFHQLTIILQSVLPVNFKQLKKLGITPENIQYLNNFLSRKAQKPGIEFVNLNTEFSDHSGNLNPKYTQDGLHLNETGYSIWKQNIEKYLPGHE